MTASPPTTTITPDPTVGFRRRVAAVLLPFGFALQIAANATYAFQTMDGGSEETGEQTLALYGSDPGAFTFAITVAIIGALLVTPGIFVAVRLLRTTVPRLSLIAGVVISAGYLCYAALNGNGYLTIALASESVDAGSAIDLAQSNPVALPLFLTFVIGNIVGPVLLAIAIFRSRAVPSWAGIGILAWPISHIVGLTVGSEWFEVAGGTLQVIGFAAIAAIALRMSNEEWTRRG